MPYVETMANLRVLYKSIAALLVVLISLQYFYFYPLNLNLNMNSLTRVSSDQGSRLINNVESLFYFNPESKRSHRESYSSSDDFNGKLSSRDLELFPPFADSPHDLRHSSTSVNNLTHQQINKFKQGILGTLASNQSRHELPLCPSPPPTLRGYTRVVLSSPTLDQISRLHPEIELGGHYRPPKCRSKNKVAIILPFRDREEHLRIFLFNLHPFLQRQQIEYNIFVIEQGGQSKSEPFNRAMLFNVGFMEASKREAFDCYIFHDVDLIPENDHNPYNCPEQPRHMSVAVDKMNYKLPYKTLFGGISALTKDQFIKVNGFSNLFWGWGAEDDDMANRIAYHGLYISRPSPDVARYKMLKHKPQRLNNNRYKILHKGKQRFKTDGISNLNYTVEQIILEKLYTLIRVQLYRVGEG